MKAKLVAVEGYNYVKTDTGEVKEGRYLYIESCDEYDEDDGKGNYLYGKVSEKIYVGRRFRTSTEDLRAMLGEVVELVYERRIGSNQNEQLVEVKLV